MALATEESFGKGIPQLDLIEINFKDWPFFSQHWLLSHSRNSRQCLLLGVRPHKSIAVVPLEIVKADMFELRRVQNDMQHLGPPTPDVSPQAMQRQSLKTREGRQFEFRMSDVEFLGVIFMGRHPSHL